MFKTFVSLLSGHAPYELGTMMTGTDKRLGELGCAHAQLQYHVWKMFNSDTERISSHGHKPSEPSK
jgi:hypothetical protein